MITFENKQTFFVDVDDTLICWDLSKFQENEPRIIMQVENLHAEVIPNKKNINTLIKFAKMGYAVIVWSRTGEDWALEAINKLNLNAYVMACMSKPLFYLDDKECQTWMGQRIWRDPIDGKEAEE